MLRHIFNTVTAALLAMVIAVRLELPAPQITMVCVFIVMQPQPGQVFAKGYYRMLGTVAGALAAWAMATLFSRSPALFLAAAGVWVALMTAIAAYYSQLTAYAILLTGYTPVLIGIPMLSEAGRMGGGAASRLAEVALGIACASVVAFINGARAGNGAAAGATPAQPTQPPQTTQAAMPTQSAVPARPPHPAGVPTQPLQPALPVRADQTALPARIGKAGSASLAGLHPAIAMAAMASLWLATSWRGGAMATLNATVNCALVALAAQPVRTALQMTLGTLLAIAAGIALQLYYPLLPASLPAAPYVLHASALAFGAWMTGRPDSLGRGLGYSITLCMLGYPGGSLLGGADAAGHHLHDAAGLALSVLVQTAICAVLWPLRQRTMPT